MKKGFLAFFVIVLSSALAIILFPDTLIIAPMVEFAVAVGFIVDAIDGLKKPSDEKDK